MRVNAQLVFFRVIFSADRSSCERQSGRRAEWHYNGLQSLELISGKCQRVAIHHHFLSGACLQNLSNRSNPVVDGGDMECGQFEGAAHSILGLERPCDSSLSNCLQSFPDSVDTTVVLDDGARTNEVRAIEGKTTVGTSVKQCVM